MERLIQESIVAAIRFALWLVRAPIALAVWVPRLARRLAGAHLLATRDALLCPGCGTNVPLVGRYECGRCHLVFDGFAFARCAVCGEVPPFVTCPNCGVGLMNPLR